MEGAKFITLEVIPDYYTVDTLSPGHSYVYGSFIHWHVKNVFQHVLSCKTGHWIICLIINKFSIGGDQIHKVWGNYWHFYCQYSFTRTFLCVPFIQCHVHVQNMTHVYFNMSSVAKLETQLFPLSLTNFHLEGTFFNHDELEYQHVVLLVASFNREHIQQLTMLTSSIMMKVNSDMLSSYLHDWT